MSALRRAQPSPRGKGKACLRPVQTYSTCRGTMAGRWRLAPLANLDNMRKRAKSLVRQHRSGSFPVASRLRVAVPAFAGLRDRDILDTPFSLADAQNVVAREVGF